MDEHERLAEQFRASSSNFTITDRKIVAIDLLADSERLRELDLTILKK